VIEDVGLELLMGAAQVDAGASLGGGNIESDFNGYSASLSSLA